MEFARDDEQRSIPAIAKDSDATAQISALLGELPTTHRLLMGDSREVVPSLPENSVHLAITSPPYWTLKEYEDHPDQLGHVDDYEEFLSAIDIVWEGVLRTLVPGGRLIIIVGDVCLSRRKFGRHVVVPLHASIQEHCRALGYDNLAPIIWHKIANANLEVPNGSSFLGKPYEPNAVVKNDIEYILFQRKPGGYRKPSLAARVMSVISTDIHRQCFQQIWTLGGASTRKHPAPYPPKLAERLIRMFSFVGDTVLDPFMGTGTSNVVAAGLGRNSIGVEVEPSYFGMAESALRRTQESQKRLPV
ncbi:MAG: site-specific DNA-methyltransferase [Dehalococcoidia bacterium]|nr:site-specific DNA-methyltransferase [Dehalococcoidia bacterium]